MCLSLSAPCSVIVDYITVSRLAWLMVFTRLGLRCGDANKPAISSVCVYTNMYVCVCMCVYVCVCIYVCMYVYVCRCVCILCMYVCVRMYVCVYVCGAWWPSDAGLCPLDPWVMGSSPTSQMNIVQSSFSALHHPHQSTQL